MTLMSLKTLKILLEKKTEKHLEIQSIGDIYSTNHFIRIFKKMIIPSKGFFSKCLKKFFPNLKTARPFM